MNSLPFFNYSQYLKKKYGETVYRVSVDAGFSCPHRGDNRRNPGCIYCDEQGSRAPYLGDTHAIHEQVQGAIAFLKKRYKAKQFILYFQAFSNTFAPVKKLKAIYDYGLGLADFKELIVSTRPDCIDSKKASLLSSYKKKGIEVWIELGLQSAQDNTLNLIKRGHSLKDFIKAYQILKQKHLKIAIHLIFGLPGEGMKEIIATVKFVASLLPDGVKIHNIHIPYNTLLYEQYLKGEIIVPSAEHHLEYTIKALTLLPPQTVIMRLTCDTPQEKLAAPRFFWKKSHFYNIIKQEMIKRSINQGCFFKKKGKIHV